MPAVPARTAPAERVQAIQVTPRARAWLAATTAGEILHVFDAAAYAVNANGDILALTPARLGTGPLSLVIPALARHLSEWISVGAHVLVNDEGLRTGRLHIGLTGARFWNACPAWQRLVPHRARLADRWEGLRESALRHGPPESLASLLKHRTSVPASRTASDRLQTAARDAAHRLLGALACKVRGESVSPAVSLAEAATELAGLGTGFTPAGDDFLVGVMYALWSTVPDLHAGLFSAILAEAAAPRTTRVSAAWLRAAAMGEAGDSWHALMEALLEDDPSEMEAAVARLAHVGHTSGADALAGYILGLRTLLGTPSPSTL